MSVTIKGTLQPETFSIKWKIHRFFADCQKVRDCYESPDFSIRYANNITKWRIQVCPKGYREEEKDYVSLFLFKVGESATELTVDLTLSVVSKQSTLISIKQKGRAIFPTSPSSSGWVKFIEQSFIKNVANGALIHDTLTILCEITFHPLGQNVTDSFRGYDKWLDNIGNGFADYEQLLENDNFTDVTFNVKGTTINAHKAILSCRSPVFKAMFEHDMTEKKKNVVDITDIDHGVMKELFRFIYSGKVINIDKIARELLIAADKYEVNALKALCEKNLYEKLTIDNSIELLILADMCDTLELKKLIIEFIAAHHKDVVRKPEFKNLNVDVMYQTMLAISEKH